MSAVQHERQEGDVLRHRARIDLHPKFSNPDLIPPWIIAAKRAAEQMSVDVDHVEIPEVVLSPEAQVARDVVFRGTNLVAFRTEIAA